MRTRLNGFRALTAGIAVAAAVLFTTPIASAQFRGGGFMGNTGEPQVTSEELKRYGEMLSLNEDQQLTLEALHQAYIADYEKVTQRLEEIREGAMEEWRENRDQQVWEDMGEAMRGVQEEGDALTETFLADFKLLLNEEQEGSWDELERTRRRERTLDRGISVLSGDSVDVYELLSEVELNEQERESIKPVMEQYAMELDRALIERNEMFEDGMRRGMELWRERNLEEIQKLFEQGREHAAKIRDLNRATVRQAMGTVSPESAQRIEREFLRESYPRVYRDNYVVNAFATVLERDDLAQDQREQVQALQDRYERQAQPLNDAWVKEIDEAEASGDWQEMFRRGRGWGRDRSEAETSRREHDRQSFEQLSSILTEEQRAALPPRPGSGEWREGGDRDGSRGPGRDGEGRRGRGGRGGGGADA